MNAGSSSLVSGSPHLSSSKSGSISGGSGISTGGLLSSVSSFTGSLVFMGLTLTVGCLDVVADEVLGCGVDSGISSIIDGSISEAGRSEDGVISSGSILSVSAVVLAVMPKQSSLSSVSCLSVVQMPIVMVSVCTSNLSDSGMPNMS